VLDQWLMIVALAATAELALASLSSGRFTLGFYTGRMFSVITSTAVLGVLLAETTKLYGQLARSNMLLGRERKNKLVSMEAMAASISHELNLPLTAISMNGEAGLSYLEVMPPHLEEVRESLDLIVRDSHRASQILLSVRALLGKRDSKQEPVDLNEIVAESLRTLRRELTGGGITTRVQLAPDLLPIMGSRNQLNEVIINLVRNATEAMQQVEDDHRVLQVSTGHQDNAITLAVEDSGPGISPENLDRIFDAFVTTKPQGMGLGLAICQMIIERHAGQLSVSSADRHGAIFRIVLPRMELPH
jgi:signal transduction histidine kinase